MFLKLILIYIVFSWAMSLCGHSQTLTTPGFRAYVYYPPSKDKESWQRLNLQLSSTFIVVVKEGQVGHDTCLLTASRSLGMSRFSVLAEGIGDPELFGQSQWIDRQEPRTAIRLLSKTTGVKHLRLLVLLGAYYAFKPDNYPKYKDSVEYFLHKAAEESKFLKEEKLGRIARCLLGKMYVQVNDNKGDSIYSALINECRQAGDKETEARAFAYRGMYMAPSQATFQQKVIDLQTASDLYHQLGNTEAEINVVTDLGYMFVVSGQLQPAKDAFLKALELAEKIRYPYIQYNTDALAMVTNFQAKFGEPFRYTLQTIKVAEGCRDSIGLGYFYSRLSNLYDSEGRRQECLDMAQKAINRFIRDRNPTVYTILNTIVGQMCEEGRAAEALNLIQHVSNKVDTPTTFADIFAYNHVLTGCYLYLKKYDLAETHIRKMDSLENKSEAVRGPLRRTIISDFLGVLFFDRGEYGKAKEYLEMHFTTPSYGQHTLLDDLHIYRWLIITDSALGDNKSAVAHYKKYTQLLDSNFRVTKIRQAEELKVLYETQEKENQITLLNGQATLQQANLKQATAVKNLTLAGIVAVIIIAGLLYRQNYLKQKSNQLITEKNNQLQDLVADKEWLLKEIHHRVKNNLQIIMSLLNSQSIYIDDDAALMAINDSQRRVQAISLIHQKLYHSENASLIDMPQYIDELVSYLKDSFDTGSGIVFVQDIEPVNLDVGNAIPLGLIINEGIVNAIKYAFPNGRKGAVGLSLKYDGPDYLILCIYDNGIGLPPNIEISKQDSLGFSLMQGLTRQLDGTLTVESNKGLNISIRFSTLNNHSHD